MTDAIRPALTPEEWEALPKPVKRSRAESDDGYLKIGTTWMVEGAQDAGEDCDYTDVVFGHAPDAALATMALANHSLPDGHPNKLTRLDVKALLEEGRDLVGYALDADTPEERARQRANGEALLSLAARIEALLPWE